MANLSWILSEWHAISSSAPNLKMDGVLFQDLYSILDTMMKKPEVKLWAQRLDEAYAHLADLDNPHQVTMNQLPTQIIDYFYAAWRNEGYQGDMDYFKDILFNYLEVIQFERLMGSDDDKTPNINREDLFPSVLTVAKYIAHHNNQIIPPPHENILDSILGGDLPGAVPIWSSWSFLNNVPDTGQLINASDGTATYYNIQAFDPSLLHAPQKWTIIGSARFNGTNLGIFGMMDSEPPTTRYAVFYNWNLRRIDVWYYDTAGVFTTILTIPMNNYLVNWDGVSDLDFPSALMYDRHELTLAVLTQKKTVKVTSQSISTIPPVPAHPSVFMATKNFHDPLHSVVLYPAAFTDEQLRFLMDQHSLPLPRTQ